MSSHARSSSADDTRSHINASLFAKRTADGTLEESLISFLKVFEDDPDGESKTRYLILAVSRMGKVAIHKAKRNSNMSFSKGKTWNLEDVRVLEVIGSSNFALTMTTRRYIWATERPKDQNAFLATLTKVYKSYTNGHFPELINFNPSSNTPSAQAYISQNQPHLPFAPSAFPTSRAYNALVPPQQLGHSHRAGSVSSINSSQTQSSNYPSTAIAYSESSRNRISLEDDRSPPSSYGNSAFGRSPFSDRARRPSTDDNRAPSPRVGHGQGVGLGQSPVQRKISDDRIDRLTPSNLKIVSATSDDGPIGAESIRTRRNESDMGLIAEPEERSSSKLGRVEKNRGDRQLDRPLFANETRTQTGAQTPIITTTDLSSSPGPSTTPTSKSSRLNRRASFHPPPLDTTISRDVLLQTRTGLLPGAAGMTIDVAEDGDAILKNVEDILEDFDWGIGAGHLGPGLEKRKKGSDAIEGRLLDELAALDSANIHAFLESDDRTVQVLGNIDEALMDLEDMDLQITGYRMQLNAVSDDVAFIIKSGALGG
nr:hypothetical protein L204_00790 [Cryptococcus depauperatus CBS 7855]